MSESVNRVAVTLAGYMAIGELHRASDAAREAISCLRQPRVEGLTCRQAEIVRQMCLGKSNKLVANAIGIAENTVKFHTKRLLKHYRASNRTEMVLIALGIIEQE